MALIHSPGPRARRFLRLLERREHVPLSERARFDQELFEQLGRNWAIVFTDTADFTIRSVRHGLPHFMMSFLRAAQAAAPVVARSGGEIVKLEGDSLMLRYTSVSAACRGVDALEALLRRFNRGRRENELVRFSYGIGWGTLLDIEHDLFGLEVNLASKLGEDLARPGEALLTPAAAAALDRRWSRRLEPYAALRLVDQRIDVQRLRPKR